MMRYCMDKYRALGPVRGGLIQQVLSEMGLKNINDVPNDRFGEFFVKVEAL